MSYCEIYIFGKGGNISESIEIQNANTWSDFVWRYLERKYLPERQFSRVITGALGEIEALFTNPAVSKVDKAMLEMTFSWRLLRIQDLIKYVPSIELALLRAVDELNSNLPESDWYFKKTAEPATPGYMYHVYPSMLSAYVVIYKLKEILYDRTKHSNISAIGFNLHSCQGENWITCCNQDQVAVGAAECLTYNSLWRSHTWMWNY